MSTPSDEILREVLREEWSKLELPGMGYDEDDTFNYAFQKVVENTQQRTQVNEGKVRMIGLMVYDEVTGEDSQPDEPEPAE